MTYINVNINTDVRIDLDDHLDDILEFLESKDYIVFQSFDEIGFDYLIEVLESNNYIVTQNTDYIFPVDDPKLDLKRAICDFLNIGYYTKKAEILRLLGEKFKD